MAVDSKLPYQRGELGVRTRQLYSALRRARQRFRRDLLDAPVPGRRVVGGIVRRNAIGKAQTPARPQPLAPLPEQGRALGERLHDQETVGADEIVLPVRLERQRL